MRTELRFEAYRIRKPRATMKNAPMTMEQAVMTVTCVRLNFVSETGHKTDKL